MKMYFEFLNFFEKVREILQFFANNLFKKNLYRFSKKVSIERFLTLLCACILTWSLFVLHLCPQPSKKSLGEGVFEQFL